LRTKPVNKKINIVSLGCSKNLVDSEVLMGQLASNQIDFQFEKDKSANIVVINTCGFINDAKQESIDTILHYVDKKKKGDIEEVFVMGCLSERYKKDIQKEIPDVDEYFGVNNMKQIVERLGGKYRKSLLGQRNISTPSHYAYLKIAEGCNRKCSFCAIPIIRGKHVSRQMEDIISEAKALIERGVKEIILISQDLAYYGLDSNKRKELPQLIDKLAALPGLGWLRLHYLYPDSFPEELIEVMGNHQNICNYIDMPVQHISDRILTSMRRGHRREETYKILESIQRKLPDAAMRTTLIVGYPGETEEDFNELLEFVRKVQFDRLGVFTYSAEEDTSAFILPDDVPEEVKNERFGRLMEVQQEISNLLNRKKVGKKLKVLIDRVEGDYYVGRTEYDSPEVDNEVLILSENGKLRIGEFYQVKISKATDFDLFGTVSRF
jgi:ribosomal protein S12 methylthiotransferase